MYDPVIEESGVKPSRPGFHSSPFPEAGTEAVAGIVPALGRWWRP